MIQLLTVGVLVGILHKMLDAVKDPVIKESELGVVRVLGGVAVLFM